MSRPILPLRLKLIVPWWMAAEGLQPGLRYGLKPCFGCACPSPGLRAEPWQLWASHPTAQSEQGDMVATRDMVAARPLFTPGCLGI